MAQSISETPERILVAASKTAATAGMMLVFIGFTLLMVLCLYRQQMGTDLMAAFSVAAGYLLHAGVSMVRSAF